ncbi:MAG: helix-turn-helix transcriptional regulator [Acidimicrobiales bacterium]
MSEKLTRLLSPEALAEYLGVPVATIYQWNYRRSGPRALRVGRHLRFRPEDIQSWLDAQAVRAR